MGRTYQRVIDLLNEEVPAKISRNAFCKKTGINVNSFDRYKAGISEPTTATLEKLSKYFNVSVGELRGERVLDGFACRDNDVIFYFDKGKPDEEMISIPMRAIIELGSNLALLILKGHVPEYMPQDIVDMLQPFAKKSHNGKIRNVEYYAFGTVDPTPPPDPDPQKRVKKKK